MPHTIVFWDEASEYEIPARWSICTRCEGEGKHGNPAFDGESVARLRDEDPDFLDRLIARDYDVRCRTCNGTGKVLIADHMCCTPEQIQTYVDYKRAERRMEQEDQYLRRLEAGPEG
jgi:RecJ-like exonuclease